MRYCDRRVTSYCLVILTVSALVSTRAAGQVIRRYGSTWVNYRDAGKVYRVAGYETWETFDPKTIIRRLYFRRPSEKKRRLIYKHEREVFITIGHNGQLALINDCFATKACKVVTVGIETGIVREIDAAANRYSKKANPDPRLMIVPEAHGFSPDDRQVLIQMDLIYVSVPATEEARNVGKAFKPRSYSVDSVSGRVLHEFRASPLPREWWNF